MLEIILVQVLLAASDVIVIVYHCYMLSQLNRKW